MRKKIVSLFVILLLLFSFCREGFAELSQPDENVSIAQPYAEAGTLFVAANKKIFNNLMANLMTRDKTNIESFYYSHRVIILVENVPVRILESHFWENTAKVEVLDGIHKGKVGWILLQQVTGY